MTSETSRWDGVESSEKVESPEERDRAAAANRGAPSGPSGTGRQAGTGRHLADAVRDDAQATAQRHVLELFRQGIALAEAVARTEEDIAKTMHEMAGQYTGASAERKRTLAEEATRGIHTAAEHGERLQRLADQFISYAQISAMRRLLHHAATTLEELARTERAIAGAFDNLVCPDGSVAADERRRRSQAATAAADSALLRAQDLHRLASDLAPSGTPPPTPTRGG